jgi:uncharacterized protein
MAWKFEVYPDSSSSYRWRLKAENGQVVASSGESFDSKRNAKTAAENARPTPGAPPSSNCSSSSSSRSILQRARVTFRQAQLAGLQEAAHDLAAAGLGEAGDELDLAGGDACAELLAGELQ